MSVLDELRAAEERVAQRLKELEPAVAEYRELEVVAQRLGLDVATAPSADPAPSDKPAPSAKPPRRRASRRPAASAKRTATAKRPGGRRSNVKPGERSEHLLALVRSRPGVTVREAGEEFGVDPTSLYRIVRKLEERGEVRKNGRALEPVSAAK